MEERLFLDLGLNNTGWVLTKGYTPYKWDVIQSGTVSPKDLHPTIQTNISVVVLAKMGNLAQELLNIFASCNNLVGIYVELPPGGSKSKRACEFMSASKAVIVSLAIAKGIPLVCYSPSACKKAATGNRYATKEEIRDAVRKQFPKCKDWKVDRRGKELKGANEHIYDAFSVLIKVKKEDENARTRKLRKPSKTRKRSIGDSSSP